MTTRLILLLGAAALVLAGCGDGGGGGGGGGDGDGSPVANRLTGTVATGAPMAKARVVVKDKNNEKATAKVGGDGRYEVNIAGMAAPFIAQAKGYVGGQPTTYYALLRAVPDSHVLNITQTTDAVARNAGIDSAEVFKTPAQLSDAEKVNFDNVKRVSERLASVLKDYFEAVGLKSTSGETLDVTTTKFAADKVDPVDRLLECLSYDAATGTLTVKSFCSGAAAAKVDLKTPTPAALPAPNAETLDYMKTNGPLIDKMVQRLSDAMSGGSVDELSKVLNELSTDTVLDALYDTDHGHYSTNPAYSKEQKVKRHVERFSKEKRLALATGNIVGVNEDGNTINMCITATAFYALGGENPPYALGLIMQRNAAGAWQAVDDFEDDRCKHITPAGSIRLRAVTSYQTDSAPAKKANRISSPHLYQMCVVTTKTTQNGTTESSYCAPNNSLKYDIDVSYLKPAAGQSPVKLEAYFQKLVEDKVGGDPSKNSFSELSRRGAEGNDFTIDASGKVTLNYFEICAGAHSVGGNKKPIIPLKCEPAPGVE